MTDKKQGQQAPLKPIFVTLSEATPLVSNKLSPPREESARLFSAAPQEPRKPVVWKRLVPKEKQPLTEVPAPKTPGL